MTVSVIILTKGRERRAQLDLLQRSLERNWPDADVTTISTPAGPDFEAAVKLNLLGAHEYVCFMCDDGIVYRPVLDEWRYVFHEAAGRHSVLCFSLRLGQNTTHFYPSGFRNGIPPAAFGSWGGWWNWTTVSWEAGGDFYYPGSLDGHIFRRDDLLTMLDGYAYSNPTALECALVGGCNMLATQRPVMTCGSHSCYVGVPVNRVSEQSNVRYGTKYDQPAEMLNALYDCGTRIDLDYLDFSQVDGAHTELDLIGAMR